MNNASSIAKISLLILLAAASGCGQNKEKSSQAVPAQAGQPQSSPDGQTAAPQKGALVASPQDASDAAIAKEQVINSLKASDFGAIYKQASAGFREVGSEQQFIALWQKQLLETGAFKEAKQTSQSIRPADRFLLFTYQVQYANMSKELRLTFGRSKAGKLELTGINQKQI